MADRANLPFEALENDLRDVIKEYCCGDEECEEYVFQRFLEQAALIGESAVNSQSSVKPIGLFSLG